MLAYIVRRLLVLVPITLLVAIIAFILIRVARGDPAAVLVGPGATELELAQMRRQLGLERPVAVQFLVWLSGVLQGDLGRSFFLGRDVGTAIIERMPATLQLTLLALFLSVILGLPAGVIAAVKHNTITDRLVMVAALIGVCMPVFWLGLLFIWVFAVHLRWFPSGGYVSVFQSFLQGLRYTLLPALSLGVLHAAFIARVTRSSMLEVLLQDYVRTARAKGQSERVVVSRHALRNAMIPTLTAIGLSFGALLSGVVIVETVFTYPGVGRLAVQAVQQRDYNVVQGALLVVAGILVLVNLLVDVTYCFFDPRIRYE